MVLPCAEIATPQQEQIEKSTGMERSHGVQTTVNEALLSKLTNMEPRAAPKLSETAPLPEMPPRLSPAL